MRQGATNERMSAGVRTLPGTRSASVPIITASARCVDQAKSLRDGRSERIDRFMILDGKELYHFGASLKDLGRKYCAVTKMDAMFIPSILERI